MGIEQGQSTLLLSLAGVLPMRLDEKGRDSCDEVELRLETAAKIRVPFPPGRSYHSHVYAA